MNYTVLIEQDEDGIYIAKVPDIEGCYTQGKIIEQALERVREAKQVCLEAEELQDILPLKFIGIRQVEIKEKSLRNRRLVFFSNAVQSLDLNGMKPAT